MQRLIASIKRRSRILEAAETSPDLQAKLKEAARRDVVKFVRDFCWAHDPRLADEGLPTSIPFDPWPRQAAFLRWLDDRIRGADPGLVEKSRAWGGTYLCAFKAVHSWLFREGYVTTFGSYKEAKVDKRNDPSTIIEKVRLVIEALPWWLRPEKWERGSDYDNFCLIRNPDNSCVIAGEIGEDMGRGGRSSVYYLDEFAFFPNAVATDAAVSENARTVIYLSTVNGMDNLFAEKRHSGRVSVFVMDWRDDPDKNEAWRQKKLKDFGPLVVAKEIDRDYFATDQEVVIPGNWVQAALQLDLPPTGELAMALDVATTGTAESVLAGRQGPAAVSLEAWTGCNTTETFRKAAEVCERKQAATLGFDVVGVGAGVQGAYQSSDQHYSFEIKAINGGSAASRRSVDDAPREPACDRFANLRAEAIWRLRRRFEKTWERVSGVRLWPDAECISLYRVRDDHELVTQISTPRIKHTDRGIRIESKKEMRSRGVKSPDRFDALWMAFLEIPGRVFLIGRA